MATPQAGWYPDPYAAKDSGILRWYDGSSWTQDVRRPQQARPPERKAAVRPAAQHHPQPVEGASWDSIPQPGTTYTADALNNAPPRIRVLPLAIVLLALIALIAFATRGG